MWIARDLSQWLTKCNEVNFKVWEAKGHSHMLLSIDVSERESLLTSISYSSSKNTQKYFMGMRLS